MSASTEHRQVLADTAGLVAMLVGALVPNCEGACLGASALLAVTLGEQGYANIDAVNGFYGHEPHWWLETAGCVVDATRGQFDDGPLVTAIGDDTAYMENSRVGARWTDEQAVMEFVRLFECPIFEHAHGARQMLCELKRLASTHEKQGGRNG